MIPIVVKMIPGFAATIEARGARAFA